MDLRLHETHTINRSSLSQLQLWIPPR